MYILAGSGLEPFHITFEHDEVTRLMSMASMVDHSYENYGKYGSQEMAVAKQSEG